MHLPADGLDPGASGRRVPERQELVAPGHRGRTSKQDMLDVVELEHAPLYCIWSSISENFSLSRSAFLISSAET